MSHRRLFLKSFSSLPPAAVLVNLNLAAVVSAGLQEIEARLAERRVKTFLVEHLKVLR